MSKDRTIRVGFIGVGQIGKMHLEQYAKIAGADVVAVADINEAEARRLSRFVPHGHSAGLILPQAENRSEAFPLTLDLRRSHGIR